MTQKICLKIGGSTVDTPGLLEELSRGIQLLASKGYAVTVVHGGGKDIARELKRLNKEFTFVEGMRVTDAQTMHTVEMVLSGDVNKRIVRAFLAQGVKAWGMSGVDASLFRVHPLIIAGQDLGFVGSIHNVNTAPVEICLDNNYVPVISPVSLGDDGQTYNVNADSAASEMAKALNADHLVFISDVPGVLIDNSVRHQITCDELESLIDAQHITGGMIPKLRGAVEAVENGVGNVHICGWRGVSTVWDELTDETMHGTVIR